jgi:hypothetical protein
MKTPVANTARVATMNAPSLANLDMISPTIASEISSRN